MTLTIRTLKQADHAWITALAFAGERDGHFSKRSGEHSPQLLAGIAQGKTIYMGKTRNGGEWVTQIYPRLWVADWEGVRAGFLMTSQDEDGYELCMAATDPKRRRKGCFRALVEHALASAPPGVRIYARCYAPSYAAVALFKAMGFVLTTPGKGSAPDEYTYMPPARGQPAVAPVAQEASKPRSWWARIFGRT